MSKSVHERRDEIIAFLSDKDYVTVEELAEKFSVSSVTIRSDLDALEQKGLLHRTHGGATSPEQKSIARLVTKTINEYKSEKEIIAEASSRFISRGDTVIIDSGSTTVHVTNFLSDKKVTMVTGSLLALERVLNDESVEVVVLGGSLRRFSLGAIGYFTRLQLEKLHADIFFMGASGYTEEGIFCSNVIESETKMAMIKSSSKTCFLADSSKDGTRAFARVCSWSDIDIFVTDKISEDLKAKLESSGVEVVIASRD